LDDARAHVFQDVQRRNVQKRAEALLELKEARQDRGQPELLGELLEREQELFQHGAGTWQAVAILLQEGIARR
jgi:hypothetical protein